MLNSEGGETFNMKNMLQRSLPCKTRGIAYKNHLIDGYRAQHGLQSAMADEGGGLLVIK